jgi:hypothetical protein
MGELMTKRGSDRGGGGQREGDITNISDALDHNQALLRLAATGDVRVPAAPIRSCDLWAVPCRTHSCTSRQP